MRQVASKQYGLLFGARGAPQEVCHDARESVLCLLLAIFRNILGMDLEKCEGREAAKGSKMCERKVSMGTTREVDEKEQGCEGKRLRLLNPVCSIEVLGIGGSS